ncbi:Asp-tRNA(Asn)/Glu-tRNA(Gln) amidotransferase subunit GatC [bacterium]|jgi:aspartyl-tRNA(Asn)/glutamyl-tRNA(Gln) amidotransferase subunit C|nr:Asp-tRNA(Asn)/Glu-tRNA(Gln) amidotransferase subunit GatC [bacterium]
MQAPIEVNEALTRKISDLARIQLTDTEVTTFTTQLKDILAYVDQLSEVNVAGVEPMTHPLDPETPTREDIAAPFETDAEGKPKVLLHAPEKMYDSFQVPPIL